MAEAKEEEVETEGGEKATEIGTTEKIEEIGETEETETTTIGTEAMFEEVTEIEVETETESEATTGTEVTTGREVMIEAEHTTERIDEIETTIVIGTTTGAIGGTMRTIETTVEKIMKGDRIMMIAEEVTGDVNPTTERRSQPERNND